LDSRHVHQLWVHRLWLNNVPLLTAHSYPLTARV